MNVLVVPMFALSRMGGPWSRAQAIAAAFQRAGHHVVLGMADDGNCLNPHVTDTCQLPVPSPLGLPMAVASRTFPLAEKLGISGRKPVHSFEEVLWLTCALAYDYERAFAEIYRVLKPGGLFICETVLSNVERDEEVRRKAREIGNNVQSAPSKRYFEELIANLGFTSAQYLDANVVEADAGFKHTYKVPIVETDEDVVYVASVANIYK